MSLAGNLDSGLTLAVQESTVELSAAVPQAVGTAAAGVGTKASRDDHVHAHGNQLGGTLHAAASAAGGGTAGFMSAADKIKLDGIPSTAVASTRLISTTAPLAGGGDLSADRTLTISAATGLAAGSMSAADKAKLDIFFSTPETVTGPGAASIALRVTFLAPTGAGNAITLADGTYAGQPKFFHIGATEPGAKSCVVTPANFGTHTNFQMTSADAWIELVWDGSEWQWLSTSSAGVNIT